MTNSFVTFLTNFLSKFRRIFSKKSKWLSQAEYRSRAELIDKMIWPTTGKKSPGGGNNIIMLDSEDSNGNKLSYEDVVGESFVQKSFIKALKTRKV